MKLHHDAARRIPLPPSSTRQPTEQGASWRHVMTVATSLPALVRIDLNSRQRHWNCPG
jgi:hypothetical protein